MPVKSGFSSFFDELIDQAGKTYIMREEIKQRQTQLKQAEKQLQINAASVQNQINRERVDRFKTLWDMSTEELKQKYPERFMTPEQKIKAEEHEYDITQRPVEEEKTRVGIDYTKAATQKLLADIDKEKEEKGKSDILADLDGLTTDLGKRFGGLMKEAALAGDWDKVEQILVRASEYKEGMYREITTGKPETDEDKEIKAKIRTAGREKTKEARKQALAEVTNVYGLEKVRKLAEEVALEPPEQQSDDLDILKDVGKRLLKLRKK